MIFDPNAAAAPDSGIFGLPHTHDDAQVILVPVPFDATTSYQSGAALGPAAILRASKQVDLLDHHFGAVHEQGVYLAPEPETLVKLFSRARVLAEPIIAKGGADQVDTSALAEIARVGADVNDLTYGAFAALLYNGKSPGLIGGDHSTPFGAIRACADLAEALDPRGGLGVLQLDAHMDLRPAYEGFTWSHASIIYNILTQVPEVHKVVQIGIRDYSEGERDAAKGFGSRLLTCFDADWQRELLDGARFTALARRAIAALPRHVYVTFDIDALDPSLCPHTGTPVPGGLSFDQAAIILKLLAESGRVVLGFDLVEVAPGRCEDEPELDANVGARLLYKLCGLAAQRRLARARLDALTAPSGRNGSPARPRRRPTAARPAPRRAAPRASSARSRAPRRRK
ncbi:MAG: agmatinase family protein [Phycisphaerales bacterium]